MTVVCYASVGLQDGVDVCSERERDASHALTTRRVTYPSTRTVTAGAAAAVIAARTASAICDADASTAEVAKLSRTAVTAGAAAAVVTAQATVAVCSACRTAHAFEGRADQHPLTVTAGAAAAVVTTRLICAVWEALTRSNVRADESIDAVAAGTTTAVIAAHPPGAI